MSMEYFELPCFLIACWELGRVYYVMFVYNIFFNFPSLVLYVLFLGTQMLRSSLFILMNLDADGKNGLLAKVRI